MADHQSFMGNSPVDSNPAMTMAELLEQSYDLKEVRRGDILTGTIVSISPNEILVDIGAKSEGVIAGRELERLSPEDLAALSVGEQVPVFVIKPEDEEGNTLLSLARAQAEKDWLDANKLYESGEIYEGAVVGHNKGGLIVHFGQIRGFVPGSQLAGDQRTGSPAKEGQWGHMVGHKLRLKIIELDRRRNRRSEEHTSELQSPTNLVCRLLLEKKKTQHPLLPPPPPPAHNLAAHKTTPLD